MSRSQAVALEEAPCPLGCPPGDTRVLVGRDRLHNLPGEFSVVKCRTCGLIRTNPRPTLETIGFYYPDEYEPYRSTRVTLMPGPRGQVPVWKRVLLDLLAGGRELPVRPPGRLLEIGCASGAFLHEMAQLKWQVEGLEMSETAAEGARSLGYPVRSGTIETAADPAEPYDVVVGWMIFEHLHDPVCASQKLRRWTRENGWLVISVPDASSWEFKIFKDAWYGLDVPRHLYHYTPKTIKMVLMRCGWRVERIFWHKNLKNLLQSLSYLFADRGWRRLAEHFKSFADGDRLPRGQLIPGAIAGMLRQSGRMTVWANRT